ncbi:MAG TPA: histidine phosphatase family protein [Streptosporangiaceae bacterium]|nr:histidine phosphatase family protein [Streptosporangiaceae bacterium]
MTHFLYVVRHGDASPHDGPLSPVGKQQAKLTGQRLKDIPFAEIYHGPLPRATQTASLIAAFMPDIPVTSSDLVGDYLPSVPDPDGLPASFARFLGHFSDAERSEGPKLAAAAIRAFAQAGPAGTDNHTLLVTHNLLIGWLVSQALAAPAWRWLGVNQMNCAVSVIAYQPGLPPSLLTFNDARHLPAELCWTGFPPALRPSYD